MVTLKMIKHNPEKFEIPKSFIMDDDEYTVELGKLSVDRGGIELDYRECKIRIDPIDEEGKPIPRQSIVKMFAETLVAIAIAHSGDVGDIPESCIIETFPEFLLEYVFTKKGKIEL